jgi:hydroxymethylpyrimidine/phosphomethylpyrimidine kinase
MGAPAVLVTGGHGESAIDHLFDGHEHHEIPVVRHRVAATHGAGCTHSATLCARLALGDDLLSAARTAARVAADAVAHGLVEIGHGDGPVSVLHGFASVSAAQTAPSSAQAVPHIPHQE